MAAVKIEGKVLAQQVKEQVKQQVEQLKQQVLIYIHLKYIHLQKELIMMQL